MNTRTLGTLPLLMIMAWLCGCAATGGHNQAQRLVAGGQYEDAQRILLVAITRNPQDAVAHRLLGIAQYNLEKYDAAGASLAKALELNSSDAMTHFYLGLLAEQNKQIDRALYHYQSFVALRGRGDLADQARRRMLDLQTRRAEEFARQAIAHEKELSPAQLSDSTIGVVYFESRFLSDPLRPLATGLAELMASDLSKVHALRVVERMRLDQILAELQLAHSGAFDTSTAPRLGKLLGAAHVLGGALTELPGAKLRIDPNLVNTRSGEVVLPEEKVGVFDEIMKMEKDVVFSTIDRLGIKLSDAERDSIARLPTASFQAFLGYSRGLELLDQGDPKGAADEFHQAVELDPGFQQAKDEIKTAEILIHTAPSGTIRDFENRAETESSLRGRAGNTEQALSTVQDRLGFLPEAGWGHDEPYTSPYGRRGMTGTVIVEGRFDNQPGAPER